MNDHELDELDIPATDIFTQEFFFYSYSMLSREKKYFTESKEGFTYVKYFNCNKSTDKILSYLYGRTFSDKANEKGAWDSRVKANIKKEKANKLDAHETDFVDLDLMISFLIDEYRKLRRKQMDSIIKEVKNMNQMNQRCNMKISMRDATQIMNKALPHKSAVHGNMVTYAVDMSFARAFIYALSCDKNDHEVHPATFLAAANRFGLDNPTPTITKRLSTYGN